MGKCCIMGLKILILLAACTIQSDGCSFEGLLSSCHMTVGGIGMQASARINHCRKPIDITFLLQSSNKANSLNGTRSASISWKYTYVTSNQPESLEIPGSGRRILLHIVAKASLHNDEMARRRKQPGEIWLPIKAQFLVDGQASRGMQFLDETVKIKHFDDCQYLEEEDLVGKIAMGVIISIILLCLLGLGGLLYFYFHQRRRPDDEVDLVSHMERSNREAASPRRNQPNAVTREDASIHYVVPKEKGEDEEEELRVYVSTSNGLKKVERRTSSASNSTNNSSSAHSKASPQVKVPTSSKVSSTPKPNQATATPIPEANGAPPTKPRIPTPPTSADSSPKSSIAETSLTTTPGLSNRSSLGAIPKRPLRTSSSNGSASGASANGSVSSNNSTIVSR